MTKYAWLLVLTACHTAIDDDNHAAEPDASVGTGDAGAGDDATVTAIKRVAVEWGPTQDAELVELLPVGRSESTATRRIALRLSPSELPALVAGDVLLAPAEVQVTTRCDIGQVAPGCNYNPTVRAQLILTGAATDTAAGAGSKVIATQTLTCTKAEHHCMFVFRPEDASITVPELPCLASKSCHLNVVMWAWHPDARAGNVDGVLVGGNDGDYLVNGVVDGDAARLMVVRERRIDSADRAPREATKGPTFNINTNANPVVVYSLRLKPDAETLEAGEQFLVDARIVTTVASRARFSTELFLTTDPDATDGSVAAISPSSISEHNGVNCLPGAPCITRKVAVFRVEQAISDPVYLKIYAKSAVPGGGTTSVTVKRDEGWLRSVRYNASVAP